MKTSATNSRALLGARSLPIGCVLLTALSVHCGGDAADVVRRGGSSGSSDSAGVGSIADAEARSTEGGSSNAGSADEAADAGSAGAPVLDGAAMVTGVVREFGSKLPLVGALVAIADQRTITDASGLHFAG